MPNLKPLLIALGCSFAVVGCGSTANQGSRPTRFVTIQPIQVCNDFGTDCADLATFADATFKIWSQADIQVSFLPPNRLLATRFLTIDSRDEFAEISFAGGAGAYGRHPFSTRTAGPVNMWFVDAVVQGLADVFGLAWIDQNGVVISDDVLSFNAGRGRLDTVAHELGHNLGLSHSDSGAGTSNNLMNSGANRSVPDTIGDINPDGARVSRLTNDQVDRVRRSPLVTDSPTPAPNPIPADPFPSVLPLLDDSNFDAIPWGPELAAVPLGEELALSDIPRVDTEAPISPAPLSKAAFPVKSQAPSVKNGASVRAQARDVSPQDVPEPGAVSWMSAGVLAMLLWGRRRG